MEIQHIRYHNSIQHIITPHITIVSGYCLVDLHQIQSNSKKELVNDNYNNYLPAAY